MGAGRDVHSDGLIHALEVGGSHLLSKHVHETAHVKSPFLRALCDL